MDLNGFSKFLRSWRQTNSLRQIDVSELLGISQGTLSKWERGQDLPSVRRVQDIVDFISNRQGRDPFAVDRTFIAMQADIRALFEYEGARLISVSAGMRKQWPVFSTLVGKEMQQHLVGETRLIYEDVKLAQKIKAREVSIIVGVSYRHVDIPVDEPIKHRWILAFRSYAGRLLGEVVYYPCEPEARQRIEKILTFEDMLRG